MAPALFSSVSRLGFAAQEAAPLQGWQAEEFLPEQKQFSHRNVAQPALDPLPLYNTCSSFTGCESGLCSLSEQALQS